MFTHHSNSFSPSRKPYFPHISPLIKAILANNFSLAYNSRYMQAKNIVIAILAIALIGAIGYLLMNSGGDTVVVVEENEQTTPVEERLPVEPDAGIGDGAKPLEPEMMERGSETVLGTSVNGADIVAYHFGTGETELLFIGGIHGGYSPNTIELAEELVSYYTENEAELPENVTVTIIPNMNPDGATKSGAAGRFNANNVDLNRNFDCEWSETGVWRSQEVSGGSETFSEPESEAIKNYVNEYKPAAAVVWFSAEGKVYPSACEETPDRNSVELAATYATAAGYGAAAEFDAYAITGDMVNWLAKRNIPAISVLLSDHENAELTKNQKGVEAVIAKYAE